MKSILFLALLVLYSSHAALLFDTNTEKRKEIVSAFDLPESFLNDAALNALLQEKKEHYSNKHFFAAMDNAYQFIPMIKTTLSEQGLPAEFLFLAMAESNFKLRAYSRKRASGLWQFMSYTGKTYGLRIDRYVDERRDLVKSTKAATQYLKKLYSDFGKWYLAAMAYNCGEGRLRRAIKKAGSDDIYVLLDEREKYLPKETIHYIRKIISLAILATDESFLVESDYEYLLNRANAYPIASVQVAPGEDLKRVASLLSVPYKDIKKLNRHLRYDFIPPDVSEYTVYIPYIKLSEFKQKYKKESVHGLYYVHVVKRGDSLHKIGKQYKIDYKIIKQFNNLRSNVLSVNQKLVIPSRSVPKRRGYASNNYHVVRSGETLHSISRRYGTSVSKLKTLNTLSSSTIKVGDRLRIQ